ncbi:MAG: endonuclease/exonuclease/phosphatase family protein [Actinomycetota bacterium]|nr:endonuclease/exonuclease/phosphatase family protein [Actinomycetota bacterium]
MSDGGRARPTLRVASYNTRDLLDDAAAAARVVRALDPDVLCLQEVPRRLLAARRVARFADACGLRWAGGHRGSGGVTIFTSDRLEVRSSAHHRLPVRLGVRRRGYAVTVLAPPGRPWLTVASVHLGLVAAQRVEHVRQLLTQLGADVAPTRTVVAGDLNEEPGSAAYALLARHLVAVSSEALTFPTSNPDKALDVVFASPDLVVRQGSPVALDETDVRAATDHRPVWVEVEA